MNVGGTANLHGDLAVPIKLAIELTDHIQGFARIVPGGNSGVDRRRSAPVNPLDHAVVQKPTGVQAVNDDAVAV